eukprot:3033-Heterococcus_DN1.PRE.3
MDRTKFVVHHADLAELQHLSSEFLTNTETAAAESREFLIHVADTCEQCIRPGIKRLCSSAESAYRDLSCSLREFWSLGVPQANTMQAQAYFEAASVTYLGREENMTAAAVVRLDKPTHPNDITLWLQSQLNLCHQCALHRITLSSIEVRPLNTVIQEVSSDAVAASWAQYQAYLLELAAAFHERQAPRMSVLIKVLEKDRQRAVLKPFYKHFFSTNTLFADSRSTIENAQLTFGSDLSGAMPASRQEVFRISCALDDIEDSESSSDETEDGECSSFDETNGNETNGCKSSGFNKNMYSESKKRFDTHNLKCLQRDMAVVTAAVESCKAFTEEAQLLLTQLLRQQAVAAAATL